MVAAAVAAGGNELREQADSNSAVGRDCRVSRHWNKVGPQHRQALDGFLRDVDEMDVCCACNSRHRVEKNLHDFGSDYYRGAVGEPKQEREYVERKASLVANYSFL